MDNNMKIDLTGILYNEDGTFKPMTASHGNISGELANLRNTYLEAERDYFEHLLVDNDFRIFFKKMIDEYDSEALFNIAMGYMEKLESGEIETEEEKQLMKSMSPELRDSFHMYKLENIEGLICLLLAAARDKVRIHELIHTPNSHARGGR